MFDGLFNQMFGAAKPADTHYEWGGKWWLLTAEHPTYAGVFYAVEAGGPDDRAVFGKPVVLVPHEPSLAKIRRKNEADTRRHVQTVFLTLVWNSTPDVESHETGFPGRKRKAWETLMPLHLAPINSPCGTTCPARWLAPGKFAQAAPPSYVASEHADLIGTLCDGHRAMVEAYLAEHPDAWPPKETP